MAVCQALDIEHGCLPRIATPFGGGFGSCGLVCGALTGGAMAIGLALGRDKPGAPRDKAVDATRELVDSFIEEMGSSLCLELTGADLRTDEGRQHMQDHNLRERVCNPAIAYAARRTVEVLKGRYP